MMGLGYIKLAVILGGIGLVICALNRWSSKSKGLCEAEGKRWRFQIE